MALETTTHSIESQSSGGTLLPRLLLTLSVVWCALWFVHSWGYWEDDSFIHLEFARSFAAGRGFSFNGSVVYGDTAPLWVMLLAAFHQVFSNWLVTGKILCLVGMLSALAAVYIFSSRIAGLHPWRKSFASSMVLLFVLNPYFCYWSFSGMETVSAAGLALWGVVAATGRPLTFSRFLIGCALAGIAPLLRPELVFYTVILGLLLAYRRILAPKDTNMQRKAADFIAGLVLISGPTVAWALYALHTFGRIVPNTNAAKRAASDQSVPLRLVSIYSLGYPIIVMGLLVAIVYAVLNAPKLRQRFDAIRTAPVIQFGGWIFMLWTVLTAIFYIVNHTYVQTRYILVSATGLAIVVFAALLTISWRWYQYTVIGCLTLAITVSSLTVWPFIRNKVVLVETVRQQALFIRNQLPPDAPVADYNIGEIAFYSEHPIIDTGGITRPGAIPFLNSPTIDMVRWIHSQGGVYYVTYDQPVSGSVLVFEQSIPFIGWSLDPRRYATTEAFRIWKLPATIPPVATP